MANQAVWLAIGYATFGFFAVAALPASLELSVEVTYPIDESLTTGLVYFFGKRQILTRL